MIKIINGVFGYRSGNSIIPKTSKDEPFECDKATEKRLVAQGVAVYVKTPAQLKAEAEALAKAEEKAKQEAEKQAKAKAREEAIAKYKELEIGGNPNTMKIEDILAAIEKAEAEALAKAEEKAKQEAEKAGENADGNGADTDVVETDEEAPSFDGDDGVAV